MCRGDEAKVFALAHVERYRLTTQAVLARTLGAGVTGTDARRLLEELASSRKLFRHTHAGMTYFTCQQRPFTPRDLRSAFAVLWYCCMANPPKELLASDVVGRILTPVASLLGASQGDAPCVRVGHHLVRIVLAPEPREGRLVDLQRLLAALQRFAQSRACRPFLSLAALGRFVLGYLVDDPDKVRELARWLDRHPLVAFYETDRRDVRALLGDHALVIPVQVALLVTLKRPT